MSARQDRYSNVDLFEGPHVPLVTQAELEGSVVDRFRLVVERCGELPAVRSRGRSLTFAELDAWSDVVAAHLLVRPGERPDEPVVTLLPHDLGVVVASIAALKAGRPCANLDPPHPPERQAQIATLAGATRALVDAAHREAAAVIPSVAETVDIGSQPPRPGGPEAVEAAATVRRLAPRKASKDPVTIMFTSGSTGRPKGVVWAHRTLLAAHWYYQEHLELDPSDRVGLVLPFGFIGGYLTMCWGLLSGASLQMYDIRGQGAAGIAGWLREVRLTSWLVTPSLLRAAFGALQPGERLPDLRHVMAVGEASYPADVVAMRAHTGPNSIFMTGYGSSEAGPLTHHNLAASAPLPDGPVPVGWAVDSKRIRVEREDGTETEPGETGEVVALGPYLAEGYWRAPEQTAARFGVTAGGERFYRSGDLGRRDDSGCLRLMGRGDAAVKVRGYLVEPSEIEGALLASGDVAEAVVVADRSSDPVRLVAYVVPSGPARPSSASIRRALRKRLPSYMVPAAIVLMDALPRTDRGKIDRLNLPPAPAGPDLAGDPPETQWEWAMAGLWCRALNLDQVGRNDDFVELGGDSLIAEQLLSIVEDELGVRLPTSTIADAPTVAEFAALVGRARAGEVRHPSVVPLQRTGDRTPLFCFPGAGGLAIGFLGLARHLGGDRPVFGLQAHGLERRGIPDWSVGAAARRHLSHIRLLQPRGPYLLAGHSFGGLIACEAARLLRESGDDVALLTLIDSYLAGSVSAGDVALARLPSQRVDSPGAEAGTAAPGSDGNGLGFKLRVALDRGRQLVQLPFAGVVQYRGMNQYDVFFNQGRVLTLFHRIAPWPGRSLVYLADARDGSAWREVLTGETTITSLGADHDTILREPYVSMIADQMRAELDRLRL